MATLSSSCPDCGETATVTVAEAVGFGAALCWSEAVVCAACNYATEADDSGFPPSRCRNAILDDEGVWSIRMSDTSLMVALSVLRQLLSLSIPETMKVRERVPGVVWSGTQCEVDWLLVALDARGVGASKERCPVRRPPSLYLPPGSK